MTREDAERRARELGDGWVAVNVPPEGWRALRAPGLREPGAIEPPALPPRQNPVPGGAEPGLRA